MEPSTLTNVSVERHPDSPDDVHTDANGYSNGNGKVTSSEAVTTSSTAAAPAAVTTLTVTGTVSVVGMIDSEFIKKFRAKFLGTGATARPWPPASAVGMPSIAKDEFVDAFSLLFMLKEDFAPVPTDGAPGSARKLIQELIEETGWPVDMDKAPIPAPWNVAEKADQFRRYEIGCALNLMMSAYDSPAGGVGGGSTPFPPDH